MQAKPVNNVSNMNFQENVPLTGHSTMRLGGKARYFAIVQKRSEIPEAVAWAEEHKMPLIMIGRGSNIIWRDEGFEGLVLENQIKKFEIFDEDELNSFVTIGAGEVWDEAIARTVQKGLSGIEQLSLIPGTAGATPVQNVGAYGRELSDVLVSVEAYDIHERKFVNLPKPECQFGYRTSRFKTTDRERFLITAITLHLTHSNPQPPFYASLQSYLDQHNITGFTPQIIRDAVIAIRSSKLPDPEQVPNNGSFFANPVISSHKLDQLLSLHPEINYWKLDDGNVKLAAAWLVQEAGFRDYYDKETGMATWPKQSLVFINQNAKKTADLLAFKQKVVSAVRQKFGVDLVQEPELLP